MLRIVLSSARAAFQPRSDLEVSVTLRNEGAESLDLPNPAALRAAPAWRLTPWSGDEPSRVFGNEQGFAPPAGQAPRLTLEAGAAWSGQVRFFTRDLDPTPGDWALTLVMEAGGKTIESEPCRISIAEWSPAGGAAGWGETPGRAREGDTLVIQAGPGPMTLFRSPWLEDDSDRTGLDAHPAIPLTEIAAEATDCLVPTRNAPFWSDPARWWVWREQATIRAMNSAGQRQQLTLGETPAGLIAAALQPAGGDVMLAVLSQSRTRVQIVVLPRDGRAAPRLAHAIDLPAPAETAALAFGLGGAPRLTVHVTIDGAAGFLLFSSDGALLGKATGPTAIALLHGSLATHTSPDGEHFAATLARDDTGLLLLQARFSADPSLGAAVTHARLAWPDDTYEGAMPEGFGLVHGGQPQDSLDFEVSGSVEDDDEATDGDRENAPPYLPPALHGIVDFGDGRLCRLGPAGVLEPIDPAGRPIRPFVIAPTSEGAVLLCVHPSIGPFMSEL